MKKNVLKNLIENNTCSGNSSENLVNYISDYLSPLGFKSERIAVADSYSLLSLNDRGKEKWIVFSGHMDTVPVGDKTVWNTDPFVLSEDDTKYYGRGTCDMKGQIASVLSLMPDLCDNSKYNIAMALSSDEETDVKSVHKILEQLKGKINLSDIELCIVTEPTENVVGISHQGIIIGEIKVDGIAGHSSNPKNGVNAIDYAMQAVMALKSELDSIYDSNAKVSPSLTVATFDAGKADNIIPDLAKISFSIRTTSEKRQDILDRLQKSISQIEKIDSNIKAVNEKCNVNISWEEAIPPFASGDLTNINGISNLKKIDLTYGSEASFWTEENVSTIVLGSGSIDQAHKVNEYIEKSSIDEYEQILKNICC